MRSVIHLPRSLDALDPPEAKALRAALVSRIEDLRTDRVREAMLAVPRHLFVPDAGLDEAYADHPLAVGFGQTISQPTIVAIMTEALELGGDERVLEIGAGSGYQAAILSLLAKEVFSIEVVAPLGAMAKERLAALGLANVSVVVGDGYEGLPAEAPFDRIIVTAAPPTLPDALVDQLASGGILVVPVGEDGGAQRLFRHRKVGRRLETEDLGPVRFVPMVEGALRGDGEA